MGGGGIKIEKKNNRAIAIQVGWGMRVRLILPKKLRGEGGG